jgi:tRNA threonylcarbamoyladenosine biosynthesis protein TsaB
MKLLALDTSSIACSVAVQADATIVERYEEQPREHTRLLVPMIESSLGEAGITLTDLDAIILGNGPGSFIGMRIAASVAQGLAYGAGLKIVPVSSLAVVAAQVFAEHEAGEVVVTQDAHMNQVYLGIFERDEAGLPVARVDERLHDQDMIPELDGDTADSRIAAGFGWQRYPGLLAANQHLLGETADILHPRAKCLLSLGAAGLKNDLAVAPQDVVPAYLRQKVAEKPAQSS